MLSSMSCISYLRLSGVFVLRYKMEKRLGNSSRKEDYLGIMCLINFFLIIY